MTNLPLDTALGEMAIRVFATKEWMYDRFNQLVNDIGYKAALNKLNKEFLDYGIQAI